MSAKSSLKDLRKAQKLHANGQIRRAVPLYQSAIQKAGQSGDKNAFAHSLYGCGIALIAMKNYFGGTEFLEHALVYDPTSKACLYNLGMAYHAMGEIEKAKEKYHECLKVDPMFILANGNLGSIYYLEGESEKGFKYHTNALIPWTDNDEDKAGRALIRLLRGQYKLGWEEYESRWTLPAVIELNPKPTTGRRWYGEPLEGKPLLVWHEQGLGDTLMMARYLNYLPDATKVMVQPALKTLFAATFNTHCIVERGEDPGDFYWHIPFMSLAGAMDTAQNCAYIGGWHTLALPPKEPETKLTVGIYWQGSRSHMNDKDRSCPFNELRPLFAIPGIRWVSLQTPVEPNTLDTVPDAEIYEMPLDDFAETAAVIEQCDLVISVDSAVGHLSGAMGKRTWLMVPTAPEFRWGLDRTDSDWYPAHKLYRRKKSTDWDEMIVRMRLDLEAEVAPRSCVCLVHVLRLLPSGWTGSPWYLSALRWLREKRSEGTKK